MRTFTPSMASILMALPRNKRTAKDPAYLTIDALSVIVRLKPTTVMGWLNALWELGLVLQVGNRHVSTPESKWQLSANGRKVVRVLTGAV